MFFRKKKKKVDDVKKYKCGKHTYGDPIVHDWGEGAKLEIGSYTSIADGVQIFLGGEHRTEWVSTFPFNVLFEEGQGIKGHPKTKGDVIIGSDVWIASETIIMSGVTIGDGAVVGARAVVSKDVAPYTIVAGNPAQELRKRFSDEHIAKLLELQWWNWSDEKVKEFIPLLLNDDIDSFLKQSFT